MIKPFWSGRYFFYLADHLSELIIVWFAWQLTESAASVGIAVFVSRLPYWLCSILIGFLVDKLSPGKTIFFANLLSSIILVGIPMFFYIRILDYYLFCFVFWCFCIHLVKFLICLQREKLLLKSLWVMSMSRQIL